MTNKLPEWANWLARDEDGNMWAYNEKPYKHIENFWASESKALRITTSRSIYPQIRWSDEEPTEVKRIEDINVTRNPNAYIFDEIMKLQSKKNKMYGNSFDQSLNEFGEIAGASQLMHKFNRYKTLVKNKSDNTAESKRDTLIDILGYTAMLIAWGDKQEEEE